MKNCWLNIQCIAGCHFNLVNLAMDFSTLSITPLTTPLNKRNIVIIENVGLNDSTGFWWLKFSFDHELEKGIVVRITNFKHDSTSGTWTLEIEKCLYLGIKNKEELVSFDMVDELVNAKELARLQQSVSNKNLREYLHINVVPLITQKIKYTRFVPQFRFFLSYKSKDKPIMRTFKNGLKFLGYSTWIDESDMPTGAYLQPALKTSIEKCDCFVALLNEEYISQSEYCKAELLYAKQLGKIILPFGIFSEIKTYLNGELKFLNDLLISNPNEMSFFEILRRIDQTLFEFEKMAFPA